MVNDPIEDRLANLRAIAVAAKTQLALARILQAAGDVVPGMVLDSLDVEGALVAIQARVRQLRANLDGLELDDLRLAARAIAYIIQAIELELEETIALELERPT